MPVRLLTLAALLAMAGCVTPAPRAKPWSVVPASATQAIRITEAAQRLHPGKLDYGRTIRLLPEIDIPCWGVKAPGIVTTGCYTTDSLYVLWPHPRCPPGADLTCSALAHELCHLAGAGLISEEQADACSGRVVAASRLAVPGAP